MLRARYSRNNSNVLALLVFDTGIHPRNVGRSLQVLADALLEVKLEDLAREPKRLFRVFSTRGMAHSPKWYSFTIDSAGLTFPDQPAH